MWQKKVIHITSGIAEMGVYGTHVRQGWGWYQRIQSAVDVRCFSDTSDASFFSTFTC